MNKIFVVDDQKAVCYSLKRLLESEGFDVQTATSGKAALKMLKDSKPDVMLIDVKMPEMDGFEVLKKVKEADSKIQVVMMTTFSTTEMAIQAMKSGAYDYTIKPLDNNDLIGRLKGALKTKALMEDVVTVEESEDYIPGERIIGKSLKMLEVFKQIGKIAPVATTVLITGESGTGKELVARAIYHHSNRANKPFLAINCAAIPEHLIESELFGYERGAFTGADSRRIGKFEQCDGGTIFLDEIGDMPLFTQAKLLRSLQGGNFQRLGGIETVRSDVRI
ncbi:sigma-54-dependent Fis family transcriptional regulator, partial [bacterium]|nr:sigma-54-dependent Fis family transcriptional regulator [bacterium]